MLKIIRKILVYSGVLDQDLTRGWTGSALSAGNNNLPISFYHYHSSCELLNVQSLNVWWSHCRCFSSFHRHCFSFFSDFFLRIIKFAIFECLALALSLLFSLFTFPTNISSSQSSWKTSWFILLFTWNYEKRIISVQAPFKVLQCNYFLKSFSLQSLFPRQGIVVFVGKEMKKVSLHSNSKYHHHHHRCCSYHPQLCLICKTVSLMLITSRGKRPQS